MAIQSVKRLDLIAVIADIARHRGIRKKQVSPRMNTDVRGK
jgi:hypothetical protein